jgi:hypothetical protein
MGDFRTTPNAKRIALIVGIVALVASSLATTARASADDVALPSAQDKNQVIQGYYSAVSSHQYDQAYQLLGPGFYTSADALGRTYREVGTVSVDVADIPESAMAHVKVTLHWLDGSKTTIYVGTVTLAYDASAGSWLISHRDLELIHGPPIDAPANSLTLSAAVSAGSVGYQLSGTGDSGHMEIRLRNKTDRVWELTIEEGLRLDPSGSSVQSMTITKEVRIKLEPHEETTLELEVACLDISKPPPSRTNTNWTVSESVALSNYVSCTNDMVDAIENQKPSRNPDTLRRNLLQFSLWAARGASENDWAMFLYHWQGMSLDEARQTASKLAPRLQIFTEQCGSLR